MSPTLPTNPPTVEELVARLRENREALARDLTGLELNPPARRAARAIHEMESRLRQTSGSPQGGLPPLTPTAPAAVIDDDEPFPVTSPVIAVAAVPGPSTRTSNPSSATPVVVATSPPDEVGTAFRVHVGTGPPVVSLPATTTTTTTTAKEKKPKTAKAAQIQTAPSLRLGAVLQGLLTALAAAASTSPLTLALAATTVVTALIAGATRGLWSRLTQLAGLSTIVAATVAVWPLVNRLAWKQPVSDEALAMALPGALVALQSLRLVIKARGARRSTTTTTPAAAKTTTTTTTQRGVVGLAVGMAVVVAAEFALMLWQVGPAWGWLLRNPRGWLALALLVAAVVDGAAHHRRTTGFIAVGVALALGVVEVAGAWPLRFVVVHDVLVLGRVVAAGLVVVFALVVLVRIARRPRRVPEPGVSP